MPGTTLEQYRVADFLDWHEKKVLVLNPDFQRRAVWTTAAKVVLIDTLLRQMPVPKIYIRTKIDLRTKAAIREVVDGQQRLRAIIDFTNDKFSLSKRSKEYAGARYSTLPDDLKERFLTYAISVDQLVNATDTDVLEIFARLNSYNVKLNKAELRHAQFTGDFKWSVNDATVRWAALWERFGLVSKAQRLRMKDTSLMAELFGVLLRGVTAGDERVIDRLYEEFDPSFPMESDINNRLDQILGFVTHELGDVIEGALASPPQFLLLFAAIALVRNELPRGQLSDRALTLDGSELQDIEIAKENLRSLNEALEVKPATGSLADFVSASKANAHRMASREVRFPVFVRALRAAQI